MRRLFWTLAFSFACYPALSHPVAATTRLAAPAPAAAASEPDGRRGIHWELSLAAAKAKAARTGKPLLLLHLFGRLDEAFC